MPCALLRQPVVVVDVDVVVVVVRVSRGGPAVPVADGVVGGSGGRGGGGGGGEAGGGSVYGPLVLLHEVGQRAGVVPLVAVAVHPARQQVQLAVEADVDERLHSTLGPGDKAEGLVHLGRHLEVDVDEDEEEEREPAQHVGQHGDDEDLGAVARLLHHRPARQTATEMRSLVADQLVNEPYRH